MKKITLLTLLFFLTQLSFAQSTCATATSVTAGVYVVDAVNGTQVPSPLCESENGAVPSSRPPAGKWYVYTPTANYTVTVTTDISQNTPRIDTRVHIYTGNCENLVCYNGDDDSGGNGTNDDNYSSVATFNVVANTIYYIAFDNRWTSNGFSFQIIEGELVVPTPKPIEYTNQQVTTINSTYNMCIVDMNGDSKDDIVGISSNNLRIHYQNQNNSSFTVTDIPVSGTNKMPTWSLAAGDFNKDGFNDLVLGSGNGITLWKSNNTGTAYSSTTPSEYIFCQRTNFVDIDNDGNLDIFSCHDIEPNVYYINNGNGGMTYYQSGITAGSYSLGTLQSGGNYASLWTDFDNDGDLDLFISKCSGPSCELHLNNGNGTFTDVSAQAQINFTPVQSWSSAIADFDNDGYMDIMVGSNGDTGHRFFRNNFENTQQVTFTDITSGSGWDTNNNITRDYIAYDFDNDGFVDILGSGNKIMFNQGDNTFVAVSYPAISAGAVGDLNNDGFLDILNGSTVRYAVPNANNWIKLALKGIQSNSNGIGARITIYGSWGKQIRDVRSGEGFTFMSTLNTHFGLGNSTVIDQIVINWPSGSVDILSNVDANQMLTVTEGSTLSVGVINQPIFSIYPNPAKNIINIQNFNNEINLVAAEMFDLNGKKVLQSDLYNNIVNVENLSKGTYILLLKDEKGKKHAQKFIKE